MLWVKEGGPAREEGFLLSTEVDHTLNRRVSGNVRVLFFDTDSYSSRLYAYESDVLYASAVTPFFNSGLRYYVNLTYEWKKRLHLGARWAQTRYSDVRTIGTGNEQINGSSKSEIKVQCRYNF
jgi:hypothetical protein